MSIWSLRGLSVRFCRQAFILAHVRTGVAPMPVRSKLRLSLCECSNHQPSGSRCNSANAAASLEELTPLKTSFLAAITQSRSAHNNLYQMGTDLKHYSKNAELLEAVDCNVSKRNKQCGKNAELPETVDCNPSKKKKECDKNVEEPEAADCNIGKKKKIACDPLPKCDAVESKPKGGGGDDCKGGSGKGKGKEDEAAKKTKLLFAMLAAVGLGGLVLWLLSRRGQKRSDETDSSQGAVLPNSSALPKHVPYLLIGGGSAAFSAFRSIKTNDPRAKVLMITSELRKPYMRPPLSKELWYSAEKGEVSKDYRFKQWTGGERSLFYEPEEFFVEPSKLLETVNGGIAVAQGFNVKKVDPTNHVVTLSDGYEITYDECLIATGCSPKSLDIFSKALPSVKEKVMMYRSPEDFERLKRYADEKKCITIVGNGFTGSELACSLANYSKDRQVKIYQIFPESGNMSRVLPGYLSKWTTSKVESLGVCVMSQTYIKEAQRDEAALKLVLSNGKSLLTDVVVVCVGCEPNTAIAHTSGLEVDRELGGFVVNAELEARRNLFVAGDASCFYDPLLGRRRVEHHDHSVVSGRLAGENMVGKKKAYTHQSMFWSDLGPEIGYEGVGLVDASLPTVGVFALPTQNEVRRTDNLTEEPAEASGTVTVNTEAPETKCDPVEADSYERGVIFYMRDDKIVGILLWNLFNRTGLARTIINQNKKFDDLNEVAKLFEIHA